MTPPRLIEHPAALAEAALALGAAPRLALDAEGSGFHTYRSRLCVLQLARETPEGPEVYVIDALALDLAPLGPLLGEAGPLKIVHALHMDAEFLRDRGLLLDRVADTYVAAQLLGLPALGLASLVSSRLGVALDKGDLQQHDWRKRPFTPKQFDYLAGDVKHLFALADDLGRAAAAAGIEAEVDEETRHQLAKAIAPDNPGWPGWRVLGKALNPRPVAVLRRLWLLREEMAQQVDLPPARLVMDDALVGMARAAPTDERSAHRWLRGPARSPEALPRWVEAVRQGLADEPPERMVEGAPTPAERAAVQAREVAIKAWRRQEAQARGITEQAVLPGHCVRALARLERWDHASLQSIRGLGAFRADRYTEAWQKLLPCL